MRANTEKYLLELFLFYLLFLSIMMQGKKQYGFLIFFWVEKQVGLLKLTKEVKIEHTLKRKEKKTRVLYELALLVLHVAVYAGSYPIY